MRIGTYNVLGLSGFPANEAAAVIGEPGEPSNCAHFAGIFASLDCDILALQEGVAGRVMQVIARTMGYHLATFPSPIAWPGHVLSRYPIRESRVFSHPDPSGATPPFSRTFGAALLELPDGELLWVVDVHLHPADLAMRTREAEILDRRIEELETDTRRMIVLGDFNSEVPEPVHEVLAQRGFTNTMAAAGGGIELTMDTVGKNPRAIDHIYLDATLAGRLRGATVIRDAGFRHDGPQEEGVWVHSDHLPVIAEVQA